MKKIVVVIFSLVMLALGTAVARAQEPEPASADRDNPVQASVGELQDAALLRVQSSVWIDAALEKVWDMAINDIDGWWPHCYRTDSRIVFEPWAGGRVYEKFPGEGDPGAIFGNVLYIETGVLVKLDGPWGMPRANVSGGTWRFEEKDGGTLVTTSGAVIGELDPEMAKGREEGTKEVWLSLKRFVETGVRVDRSSEE